MAEDNTEELKKREWKSHTMRAIDAALTPGTLPNVVLITAVTLVLRKHRMHLMVASATISQAVELWNERCPPGQ